MLKSLFIVAAALLATACVPIPADPSAASEPTQTTEQPAECPGSYLDMLPGQSADDPISVKLPGYIDIVGVESSLDGETLTAIFHLRDIPEELSFNRKGVENLHLEYMWTVEIEVEMGDESESELVEYTFSAFYPASRTLADTPASTRPMQEAVRAELWKNKHFPEKNETHWLSVPVHARLLVSHEDNTLTLISQVPGITEESPILFSTFDILLGQDGVSCLPSTETRQRDSKIILTAPGQGSADEASDTISLEEGCGYPSMKDITLYKCDSDTAMITPGQNVIDKGSEELPAHIDIIEINTDLSGETLTVVFHMRDVPETLTFGRTCVQDNFLEYMWHVVIDVDNDLETGQDGFDYSLSASHFVPPSSSGSNREVPIEGAVQANTWEMVSGGGGTFLESVSIEVSAGSDTITLRGEIPGITSESVLAFQSYDYLNGLEKIACHSPLSSDSE